MNRVGIAAVVLAVLVVSNASAVTYTGTLSVAGGTLTGTGDWAAGPTTFIYTVDDVTTPGFWHYEYVLTVPPDVESGNIQHLIIGLTCGLSAGSLVNVNGDLHKVEWFENKGDNKEMPQDLYGADFQAIGEDLTLTVSFDTKSNPVWGDFFARGGQQNTIWNSGFTEFSVDPTLPPDDMGVCGFILRANGELPPPAIPEPMTMLTLGLAGVAISRTLRNRLARAA
ncbi:MAG: hypothetical protein FWE88_02625 [Phycisphaerae bacterium]|nr:hypothetical protein [Phycisphaerae bacterium]